MGADRTVALALLQQRHDLAGALHVDLRQADDLARHADHLEVLVGRLEQIVHLYHSAVGVKTQPSEKSRQQARKALSSRSMGWVQEEIMFACHPELNCARLVFTPMQPDEAFVLCG